MFDVKLFYATSFDDGVAHRFTGIISDTGSRREGLRFAEADYAIVAVYVRVARPVCRNSPLGLFLYYAIGFALVTWLWPDAAVSLRTAVFRGLAFGVLMTTVTAVMRRHGARFD